MSHLGWGPSEGRERAGGPYGDLEICSIYNVNGDVILSTSRQTLRSSCLILAKLTLLIFLLLISVEVLILTQTQHSAQVFSDWLLFLQSEQTADRPKLLSCVGNSLGS